MTEPPKNCCKSAIKSSRKSLNVKGKKAKTAEKTQGVKHGKRKKGAKQEKRGKTWGKEKRKKGKSAAKTAQQQIVNY